MIQQITRPFTKAEQRLLRIRATMPKVGSVPWLRDERREAIISIIGLVVLATLGFALPSPFFGIFFSGIFAIVRFSTYWERRKDRRYSLDLRQKWADDLATGTASVIICKPTRIIEHEEIEDEGAFWIFDGDDGHYLAMTGQEFYETPRFPSAHFEIVRGARHQSLIGIRSHGLRIPSTQIIQSDESTWDHYPEPDIFLFSAPPGMELREILRHLKAAVKASRDSESVRPVR